MSLLTVVQQFSARTGLPIPPTVLDSGDNQVLQLAALANELIEDLCDRWTWQLFTREALFTTVAGANQGAISTLAPQGFLRILQETIFNRTLRLPIFGPMWAQDWQAQKALPATGPLYRYRVLGNQLLFMPDAAPGHTCVFEYASNLAIAGTDGTLRAAFAEDSDTFLLSEPLLVAGLRWKWKAEKGLSYAEDFRRYETLVSNLVARDGSKPRLSLNAGVAEYKPGIWVPSGNWNITTP